ncbi:hypothetical protein C0Q70_21214 [Pomacea canaliculata]|uniref:Uncharacterized protein n=1 Tax=Pomacea canaliculata TaxID=400727 RepID=A0A2T7NBX3_POMCA|nr:hypothetical protein C0Q70_21214 [Pomacea canaliculata]
MSCPQMQEIYSSSRHGGHGQLTFTSLLLLTARSLGRVMTSAVDTRDGLMVLCHAHSCLWEATLTCQALLYVRRQRRLQLQALREKTTVADCVEDDGEEPYRPRRRRCSSVTSRCG